MTELAVRANELHEQAVADFKVSEKYYYRCVMKIKELRDKQYYKALGFDSFEAYCKEAWNVNRGYMDDRILIAESSGSEREFDRTYGQLGHSKSLILARMEPAVKQQVETQIDVNDATVKQLKEAERRAQEMEQRATQAEQDARHWQGVAKSQPVRVETKTVEVVPDHLKKELDKLKFDNNHLKHGYQEAKAKLQEYEMRKPDDFDEEEARKLREKLQHEADMNTINLRIAYKNFIEKAAITSYLQGAIAYGNPGEKERLAEMVEAAQQIIDQTKLALKGRKLGVVT